MTIVYALVSRQKTVLAEYTATSGELRKGTREFYEAAEFSANLLLLAVLYQGISTFRMTHPSL